MMHYNCQCIDRPRYKRISTALLYVRWQQIMHIMMKFHNLKTRSGRVTNSDSHNSDNSIYNDMTFTNLSSNALPFLLCGYIISIFVILAELFIVFCGRLIFYLMIRMYFHFA